MGLPTEVVLQSIFRGGEKDDVGRGGWAANKEFCPPLPEPPSYWAASRSTRGRLTGGDLKAERGAVSWRLPRKRRLEVRCPPAGESRPRTSVGAATGRGPDHRHGPRKGAAGGSERDGRVPRVAPPVHDPERSEAQNRRGGRSQALLFGLPERRLQAPATPRRGTATENENAPGRQVAGCMAASRRRGTMRHRKAALAGVERHPSCIVPGSPFAKGERHDPSGPHR